MSPDEQKKAAGEAASALVQDGMVVGLGTGSTAAYFVKALGLRVVEEKLSVRGVATSKATESLAAGVGVPVIDLGDITAPIDLTVDGADEIGPGLALIKGGGAALLREKLVWVASRRCVVIAEAAKDAGTFGAFPLPVEVVAFGHGGTAGRIAEALAGLGLVGVPKLRVKEGSEVVTDNGGLIYDLPLRAIPDPQALAAALKAITGVVEHGLFLGLAQEALIGTDDGVRRLASGGGAL